MVTRCTWCGTDPLYVAYHDTEWGVPTHDDRVHFEFLVLEAAQAGLSWITILRKREGYRKAFAGFDPARVARFTDEDVARMLGDASIVRNGQKIRAAIQNAPVLLSIQKEFGSFDAYLWHFVGGKQVKGKWTVTEQIPSKSELSERLSKDLKKRGMAFVGPTVIYSHLQAVGVINDHLTTCFRHKAKKR